MTDERHILQEIIDDIFTVEVANDLWDEAPEMLFVLNPDPDLNPTKHRVIPVLGPDFWSLGGTSDLVYAVATSMTMPDAPIPDPFIPFVTTDRFVGIIMRTEGWMLRARTDGTELTTEEVEEWTKAGKRIVDHPAAYEVKTYMAIASTGESFTKMQARREEVGPWMTGDEGRMFDALSLLVTNVKALYEKAGAVDGPLG
jgi:hypothetical protein